MKPPKAKVLLAEVVVDFRATVTGVVSFTVYDIATGSFDV